MWHTSSEIDLSVHFAYVLLDSDDSLLAVRSSATRVS
jgi:hypothetical protein